MMSWMISLHGPYGRSVRLRQYGPPFASDEIRGPPVFWGAFHFLLRPASRLRFRPRRASHGQARQRRACIFRKLPLLARNRPLFRFRMDGRRRRLRARAIAKARELRSLKRGRWGRGAILLFCTIRNEGDRIDWFLKHYRALGVESFLIL